MTHDIADWAEKVRLLENELSELTLEKTTKALFHIIHGPGWTPSHESKMPR
jgi:hypothetical protein